MTPDDTPNHRSPSPDRAPSLGGGSSYHPTRNEPSLSLDRLLPGLREALESSDRGQCLETIEQIIEGGSERVVPMLIELLTDVANAKSRQRIIAMLGQLGDARAVEPLAALLADTDPGLRKVAAWALGQIGDAAAVDGLLAQLECESNPQVAGAAILALGKMGELRALPALLSISENSTNEALASTASTAVKLIGQACTLAHLLEMMCDESEIMSNWAAELFIHHTEAPQLEHLPLLERLLNSQERMRIRQKSIHLLAVLKNEHARNIVLQSLTHPEEDIRLAALHALREHQIQGACDILLSRYSEETDRNREAIIETISVMEDPRVVPFLLDIVEIEHKPWVVTQALESRSDADIPQLLLERLQNATGDAYFQILVELRHFNTIEVVKRLLDIARNSLYEDERCAAIGSICLDEYPEATPDLIDILSQGLSVSLQENIMWALSANFGDQVETILRGYLSESDDDELRTCALDILLSHQVADASPLLLEQIDHIKDEEELASLVRHLCLLDDEFDFPIRERLYRTARTERLRGEIIDEITHCSDHDSAISLVIDALKNDSSAGIRACAIVTLYYLCGGTDQRIVQALIEALSDTGWCKTCTPRHRVCDTAATYLEKIGTLEAMTALAAWRSTQAPNSRPTQE